MNNYGVLGRYIPAFGRVVNACSTTCSTPIRSTPTPCSWSATPGAWRSELNQELPLVSPIMQRLPKPEIGTRALFHDIAKGRAGTIRARCCRAEAFCLEQGLSRYDARLVAWLVKHLRSR